MDVQPDTDRARIRRSVRGGGIHGALRTKKGKVIMNYPLSERRFTVAEQNKIAAYFERVAHMCRQYVPEFPEPGEGSLPGEGHIEAAQALCDVMSNADIDTMRLVAHAAKEALAQVERYVKDRKENSSAWDNWLSDEGKSSPCKAEGTWWLASPDEVEANRSEVEEAMSNRRMYAKGRS